MVLAWARRGARGPPPTRARRPPRRRGPRGARRSRGSSSAEGNKQRPERGGGGAGARPGRPHPCACVSRAALGPPPIKQLGSRAHDGCPWHAKPPRAALYAPRRTDPPRAPRRQRGAPAAARRRRGRGRSQRQPVLRARETVDRRVQQARGRGQVREAGEVDIRQLLGREERRVRDDGERGRVGRVRRQRRARARERGRERARVGGRRARALQQRAALGVEHGVRPAPPVAEVQQRGRHGRLEPRAADGALPAAARRLLRLARLQVCAEQRRRPGARRHAAAQPRAHLQERLLEPLAARRAGAVLVHRHRELHNVLAPPRRKAAGAVVQAARGGDAPQELCGADADRAD
ncbi:MAG: hypothetical protein J3K34DRAFT_414804 [Monoraphidium minutum]|nr:MAG: hypothetical protein J3K34DRAFT_414804 [Monoraphidium minutum]